MLKIEPKTYNTREYTHHGASFAGHWRLKDCSPVDLVGGLVVVGIDSTEDLLELSVSGHRRDSGTHECLHNLVKWQDPLSGASLHATFELAQLSKFPSSAALIVYIIALTVFAVQEVSDPLPEFVELLSLSTGISIGIGVVETLTSSSGVDH